MEDNQTNLYSFSEVKNALEDVRSVKNLLRGYGVAVPEHGNIPCISGNHEDKHPSMQIGAKGCYCHSCHEHFSVIDICMKYENCDSKTATRILNDKFNLNLQPIRRVAYEDSLPIKTGWYDFLGLHQKTAYYESVHKMDNDKHINVSLQELYAEDKLLYFVIISGKLEEKREKTKEWEDRFVSSLAESARFLNSCDIKNNMTDSEYLEKVARAIYDVTSAKSTRNQIDMDYKFCDMIQQEVDKFYKKEIEPMLKDDRTREEYNILYHDEEEIER